MALKVIWSQVAPESLSGLDIVRGTGSGPYGAGALTGVVALRERSGEGGVLDLSAGEDGGRRLSASAGLSEGRFALTGSLLREQSDVLEGAGNAHTVNFVRLFADQIFTV